MISNLTIPYSFSHLIKAAFITPFIILLIWINKQHLSIRKNWSVSTSISIRLDFKSSSLLILKYCVLRSILNEHINGVPPKLSFYLSRSPGRSWCLRKPFLIMRMNQPPKKLPRETLINRKYWTSWSEKLMPFDLSMCYFYYILTSMVFPIKKPRQTLMVLYMLLHSMK